jgi:hypothetical protein
VWVVLAVEVTLFEKSWALPVLFRLHRSEKRCKAERRAYEKLTEQARELVELLAARYPTRRFELLGDAAYTNGTLMKNRLPNVTAPRRRGQPSEGGGRAVEESDRSRVWSHGDTADHALVHAEIRRHLQRYAGNASSSLLARKTS